MTEIGACRDVHLVLYTPRALGGLEGNPVEFQRRIWNWKGVSKAHWSFDMLLVLEKFVDNH